MSPVLIFSTFRTGSTWLWNKFQHHHHTTSYYEVFHERLSITNSNDIDRFTSDSWPSNHDKKLHYFKEYLPLLEHNGGVTNYDSRMAYEWFLPFQKSSPALRSNEIRYLEMLVNHADLSNTHPILTFNRGLPRLPAISDAIPGIKIIILRNPLSQWSSYLKMRECGVDYFMRATLRMMTEYMKQPNLAENMKLFLPERFHYGKHHLSLLTLNEAWVAFFGLHFSLHLEALPSCDYVLNYDDLCSSTDSVKQYEKDLSQLVSLKLNFSDIRQSTPQNTSRRYRPNFDSISKIKEGANSLLKKYVVSKKIYGHLQHLLDDVCELYDNPKCTFKKNSIHHHANIGKKAFTERYYNRPSSRIAFEHCLDLLENQLLPEAFTFWTIN